MTTHAVPHAKFQDHFSLTGLSSSASNNETFASEINNNNASVCATTRRLIIARRVSLSFVSFARMYWMSRRCERTCENDEEKEEAFPDGASIYSY